jgi:hypothetical protein
MMNKARKRGVFGLPVALVAIGLFFIFSVFVFSSFFLASAQLPSLPQMPNPEQIAKDKIESTSKSIEDIRKAYLGQELEKLVVKNKIIGPIHTILKESVISKWAFLILFNTKYSFSFLFLLTIIVCTLIASLVEDCFKFYGFSRASSTLIGLGVMMIVAQIGVVNWLFLSLIDFISSKNKWWMRAILWALVIIFLIVISKADKILSKFIKAKEIKEKEGEKEQKLKEATRFIEGVKEGQKLSGELEKKFPKSGGWEQAGARRFKKTY